LNKIVIPIDAVSSSQNPFVVENGASTIVGAEKLKRGL